MSLVLREVYYNRIGRQKLTWFSIFRQYWLVWACVLANEYNVISSLMVFWGDQVPLYGYFLIFWFAFLGFQMLGVESFGEVRVTLDR